MNVLAIGAHFDDLELGCGGTLARHVDEGDRVIGFIATDSQYGQKGTDVFRPADIAFEEAKKAASIIGYELMVEDIQTFYVENNEVINEKLIKIIKDNKIDQIYTHWDKDVHHDHRNLASATLHVSKHVNRVLMYTSNLNDSTESFNGNFYVDISNTWNKKESAIRAYVSEMERVGIAWIEYFHNLAINNGLKNGIKYAENFSIVKWLQ